MDDSPGRIVADLLVPTTVWRIADTGVGGPGLAPRLARRLVAVYSRPGETIIDLTDLPEVKVGDGVEIVSLDAESPNSVENLARLADTIPYEILCRFGSRIRRIKTA